MPFFAVFIFCPAIFLPRKIFIFIFMAFAFGILRVDLYESGFPVLPFGQIEFVGQGLQKRSRQAASSIQMSTFKTEFGKSG